MQNEELIKALRSDAEWAHANEWETPITLGDHLDSAVDALEAAEKAQRWIPVSERLPECTDDYNVVCNIGSMLGGYTDVRTYRFECIQGREPRWCIPSKFDEVVVVTHWQPLPQPPRKDDEV